MNHAQVLIDLIAKFPMINPSDAAVVADAMQLDDAIPETEQGIEGGKKPDEVDLSSLLANIRARYRLLCSSVGARPRMTVAANGTGEDATAQVEGVVPGIEGPMKGVDTKQLLY
jgi:hypothetical protein